MLTMFLFSLILQSLSLFWNRNISVSDEEKINGCFHSLNIELLRLSNGVVKRCIYIKPKWISQYLHLASFTPLARKRGLVKILSPCQKYLHARCTPGRESFPPAIPIRSGYPAKFIDVHWSHNPKCVPTYKAMRKAACIILTFKGDHIFNNVRHKLKSPIKITFPVTEFYLLPTSRTMILDQHGTNRISYYDPHFLYHFICSCGGIYLGRTDRNLSQRMPKNIPKWCPN